MTLHRRRAAGWIPFQEDEQWAYFSERDIKVCPTCEHFDDLHNFTGDEIPRMFKGRHWIQKPKTLHPETHIGRPWLYGRCRCHMVWSNFPSILVTRLDAELRGVVH